MENKDNVFGIKRKDVSHPVWLNKSILDINKVNIFSRNELDAKLFWSDFCSIMTQVESLASYMDFAKLPKRIHHVYLDLISTNLEIINDLLFVSYGLVLDTQNKSNECVVSVSSKDNLVALGFWSLDCQREIEIICQIAGDWKKHLLYFSSQSNLESIIYPLKESDTKDIQSDFLSKIDKSSFMTAYSYAPYQYDDKSDRSMREQIDSINETMRSIFSLIANVMRTPVTILLKFEEMINEFRLSNRGKRMISAWKGDFTLPREKFIARLKEKEDLKPWVDKCYLLYEGKIEKKNLFYNSRTPLNQHNKDLDNTNNWINIFAILVVLEEYEVHQSNIRKLMSFFNSEEIARDFYVLIQNASPMQVTSLVKRYGKEEKIPKKSTGKKLYEVLKEMGLYSLSYQNWNDQT